MEPILILGKERFAGVDIRVRVRGGGNTSQVYGMPLRCQFTLSFIRLFPLDFDFRKYTIHYFNCFVHFHRFNQPSVRLLPSPLLRSTRSVRCYALLVILNDCDL
jgi:hypothetical protein